MNDRLYTTGSIAHELRVSRERVVQLIREIGLEPLRTDRAAATGYLAKMTLSACGHIGGSDGACSSQPDDQECCEL